MDHTDTLTGTAGQDDAAQPAWCADGSDDAAVRSPALFLAEPEGAEGQWYVLATRCRQERILAAEFSAMGVAHYLPLVTRSRNYGDQSVAVEVPLFPGYVFMRGTSEEVALAHRT